MDDGVAKEELLLKHAWKEGSQRLRRVGVKTPLLDSRLLLQAAMNITYEELLVSAKRPLTDNEKEVYEDMLLRRLKREPVAQILGYKDFWKIRLNTTKDTLDPRPDSETIIDAVLKNFTDQDRKHKILDLGVGTGALLLSLLGEYPNSEGVGVDVSPEAIKIAQENAENNNVSDRVKFIKSNWLENVEGSFDIIVCNPPIH